MNVTTETSVTVNPAQALQQALAPLLHPDVQRFMVQFYGKVMPTTEIKKHQLIIHNLPSKLQREDIDTSFIGAACHAVKHLYSDGDRTGKTSAQKKLRNGQHLENNSIRMCLTYVYFQSWKSEDYQDVTIEFLLSSDKRNPPKFFERFNRDDVSDKELEEFRRENRLISTKKGKVITWREMTEAELEVHIQAFIGTCQAEIQEHFDSLYENFMCEYTPEPCHMQAAQA